MDAHDDTPRPGWLGPSLKGVPGLPTPLAFASRHPLRIGPATGARVVRGPSPPCTTFEKWAWIAIADDHDRVVDALATHFA